MRVMVTGGAGFLGSHLCDALISRGDEVVCIDNFSTGLANNIRHREEHPRFSFIEADVTEQPDVPGSFDAVAHLASPASPPEYLRLSLETLAVGSRGSEFALEVAARSHARVLLASTSAIYGEPLVHPQTEDYWGNVNPVGPRSVYDEAKRYAESLFAAHRRTLGANTGIVRIFNTYGPRLRPLDGRVVSNFISQALAGQPVTIYGDGRQTRSFCYVDDLVAGLVAMLDSDDPGPINLGNPTETSVSELAAQVIALTASASELTYHPRPVDDPTIRRPNIDRAEHVLRWSPQVSLADGLSRTIAWQQGELAAALGVPASIRIPELSLKGTS
jgi:nucleoside-diphosphate-sugar epimerase